MNSRIAKKRAKLLVCVAFDCTMALNQAKSSFWRLPAAERANALGKFVAETFRVQRATATRAARIALGQV